MKKLFIYLILIPFITLLSCNKDDDNNPSGKKLLDHITYTTYDDTSYLEYNDDDQIILEEDSENRRTATLTGNQLQVVVYRKTESRTVADATFTLNSAGNIASGEADISYNLSDPYHTVYAYTYDNDGYLTRRSDTRDNGETWAYNYYWTNGDLTKIEWEHQDTLYLTLYYEYDTALQDKNQIDYNKLMIANTSWTGKSSQHLFTRYYNIFAPGTTIATDYHYQYTLDDDGYVELSAIDDVLGPYTEEIRYYYK